MTGFDEVWIDPDECEELAVDYLVGIIRQRTTSVITRRIGPVFSVEDLTRWMVGPGADRLTAEAIKERARNGQMVAFHSSDRQWAFPEWQFDRIDGRLEPRAEVIALWRRLPTDGLLTAVDVAAWMNTKFSQLDGLAPAEYAHRHSVDAEPLVRAVARLRARVV